MKNTLDDLIEDKKRLANGRKINFKTEEISRYFGIREPLVSSDYSIFGDYYVFENTDFRLEFLIERSVDYYSGEEYICTNMVTITFRGQVVYISSQEDIKSYIPGSWEDNIEKLYIKKVEDAQAKEKELINRRKEEWKQQKNQYEMELRRKFGL